jgi:hypothetical protein
MGFLLYPMDSRALAQTMANKQSQKKQKKQRAMQQQAHAYMEVAYLASLHDWEIVRILECNF